MTIFIFTGKKRLDLRKFSSGISSTAWERQLSDYTNIKGNIVQQGTLCLKVRRVQRTPNVNFSNRGHYRITMSCLWVSKKEWSLNKKCLI